MISLPEVFPWVIRLFFPPFIIVLFTTLVLASIGKSLGIRKLYVKALIRIFEFAGKLATEANRERQLEESGSFQIGSDDSEDNNSAESSLQTSPNHLNADKKLSDALANGGNS